MVAKISEWHPVYLFQNSTSAGVFMPLPDLLNTCLRITVVGRISGQFLHHADVMHNLQKMCCKRMAQCMATDMLIQLLKGITDFDFLLFFYIDIPKNLLIAFCNLFILKGIYPPLKRNLIVSSQRPPVKRVACFCTLKVCFIISS